MRWQGLSRPVSENNDAGFILFIPPPMTPEMHKYLYLHM